MGSVYCSRALQQNPFTTNTEQTTTKCTYSDTAFIKLHTFTIFKYRLRNVQAVWAYRGTRARTRAPFRRWVALWPLCLSVIVRISEEEQRKCVCARVRASVRVWGRERQMNGEMGSLVRGHIWKFEWTPHPAPPVRRHQPGQWVRLKICMCRINDSLLLILKTALQKPRASYCCPFALFLSLWCDNDIRDCNYSPRSLSQLQRY